MSADVERWKPIPGYKGYDVSDHGRVRSYWRQLKGNGARSGFILMEQPQRIRSTNALMNNRYPSICLRGRLIPVHRLVMAAFIGPCPDGLIVCHNDDIPGNNHLSNLRYDTPQSNLQDAMNSGNIGPGKHRKLTDEQVVTMREMAASGVTTSQLMTLFSISDSTVSRICLGKAYTDVGGPIVKRMTQATNMARRAHHDYLVGQAIQPQIEILDYPVSEQQITDLLQRINDEINRKSNPGQKQKIVNGVKELTVLWHTYLNDILEPIDDE